MEQQIRPSRCASARLPSRRAHRETCRAAGQVSRREPPGRERHTGCLLVYRGPRWPRRSPAGSGADSNAVVEEVKLKGSFPFDALKVMPPPAKDLENIPLRRVLARYGSSGGISGCGRSDLESGLLRLVELGNAGLGEGQHSGKGVHRE